MRSTPYWEGNLFFENWIPGESVALAGCTITSYNTQIVSSKIPEMYNINWERQITYVDLFRSL